MSELVFSKDNIPEENAGWDVYRKTALTSAVRLLMPFTVETSEGPLHCEDGYLAKDARGYPYPIAADEFELIYVLAESDNDGDEVDIIPDAVMKLYDNGDGTYRARFKVGDADWLETDVPAQYAAMIPLVFNQLASQAEG